MNLEKAIERANSNAFEFFCKRYCSDDHSDNRGVRRTLTLNWEHEHGEFGSILSSWPVFDVDPPCKGPRDYSSDYEFNLFDAPRNPNLCPFSEEGVCDFAPEIDEVLAMSRERKAFKKLLEGK